MKRAFLILIIMACFAGFSCKNEVKKPVSVIFDTDMGTDYDDVGALTMLYALADSGEVRILGTMSCNMCDNSAVCIDVINRYYGNDIPVGVPTSGVTSCNDGNWGDWMDILPTVFPHKLTKRADAPYAVTEYRRILSAQPDTSVVVITVGFMTNIAALLQSQPDSYSPLTGEELVRKKVKRLVSMAGAFPSGKEWNSGQDAEATRIVADKWAPPIIFSGAEIGAKIFTGKRLVASDIPETPAKKVYTIRSSREPDGRESWDQTAVLVGVRGVEPYFNTVRGRLIMYDDGNNSWQDDPNGRHEYLTFKMKPEEIGAIIEDMMMYAKH